MANSSTNLTQISSSQASKEVTANALFDAHSPASAYGRNATTSSGLTWGYYGANLLVDGVITQIANGTLTLTNSATNHVERDRAGTVTSNTTAFTAGRIPLYDVVCSGGVVTTWSDYRIPALRKTGILALAMSDANTTLTAAQSLNDILSFTGTLGAQRNIVLPLIVQQWTVANLTTGGFGLQFIGASGTGIVVANGKRALIYSDATNIVRATADV